MPVGLFGALLARDRLPVGPSITTVSDFALIFCTLCTHLGTLEAGECTDHEETMRHFSIPLRSGADEQLLHHYRTELSLPVAVFHLRNQTFAVDSRRVIASHIFLNASAALLWSLNS